MEISISINFTDYVKRQNADKMSFKNCLLFWFISTVLLLFTNIIFDYITVEFVFLFHLMSTPVV